MIQIPNIGCLIFLLLMALVGGGPLLVGFARLALFFVVVTALAGTVAAWWLGRRALPAFQQHHDRFVETLVLLLVRLAEVDGNLDRREVTVIRDFFEHQFGYRGERLLKIRDLIKAARVSPVSVEELCSRLASEFDPQARLIAMELLARVARADGAVSDAEAALLAEIAQRLGLGPFARSFQWQSYSHGRSGPSPAPDRTAEAFSVLGLEPGANPAQIKQAWRRLSKEHHPDRVTHLGEEFRRVAEERMRRINAAYDTLKAAGLAS